VSSQASEKKVSPTPLCVYCKLVENQDSPYRENEKFCSKCRFEFKDSMELWQNNGWLCIPKSVANQEISPA